MRRIALSLAALCFTAAPAFAATLHHASATTQCGGSNLGNSQSLSPTPLMFGSDAALDTCAASSMGQSGSGTTRISAGIEMRGGTGNLNLTAGKAQASASIRYSFYLATTLSNPGPVAFSVNLHASGSASAKSTKFIDGNGQFLNSGQVISSSLRVYGSISGNSQAKVFEERASVRSVPGESKSESLPGTITTPSIMVEAGDLISLTFGLSGSTSGQLFGASANGRVNAANSVSFATQGDVFNLAPGFSVVIDEARIVNNRYTPPPPMVSAVPIPAAGFGLLMGLGGLVALRRRR